MNRADKRGNPSLFPWITEESRKRGKAMLEKTKIFLKKEIGKRAEPNDDSYTAFWKEKAEISWVVFIKFVAHMGASVFGKNIKKSRELLQNTLAELLARNHNSDREIELGQWAAASKNDAYYIEILKLFFSHEYKPPADVIDKICHIIVIYRYYHDLLPSIGIPSWTTDAKVDLALLKLTQGISSEIHTIDSRITQRDHAKPGAEIKKEHGAINKGYIKTLLKTHGINKLQDLRRDKNNRTVFFEAARKKTNNLSEKRISDIAREILKEAEARQSAQSREEGTVLDTKATV
jgi:hypothetical protein